MRRPRRAAGPPGRLPSPPGPPRSPNSGYGKLTGYGKLRATTRQDYTQLPQPRRRGRKETKEEKRLQTQKPLTGTKAASSIHHEPCSP